MHKKEYLPACYRYIKEDNRSHILYTLATKNTKNNTVSATEFHSLLCAAELSSIEEPLPVPMEEVSCFTIVSNYKCGFICGLCPYSSRYKNRFASEEEILLAYSLKNYHSFQSLKKQGLNPNVFQSLFLLNEFPSGKIVATLPLLKLAYNYIEHTAKPNTDFGKYPTAIAEALDQNNHEKLLPQNIQAIREVLSRLQHEFKNIKENDIQRILDMCLNPSSVTKPSSSQPAKKDDTAPRESTTPDNKPSVECLSGLLQNTEQKKVTGKTLNDKPVISETSILQLHTSIVAKPTKSDEKSYSKEIMEDSNLYLPLSFSVKDAENTGYPFSILDGCPGELHQFEAFLLYNPIMGVELVTDDETGKDMFLFCASNSFYYVPVGNPIILPLLRTYFSKSRVRRQVCLEPYRLYYCLRQQELPYENIYSLRTAYKVLAEAQGKCEVKPLADMVKELASRENRYSLPPHIFSMLYYTKMYEVLKNNPLMHDAKIRNEFEILSGIDTLMGIAYELKDITDSPVSLFTRNHKGETCFSYHPDMIMKNGICSVTFTLSAAGPLNSLVSNLLYRFAKQHLTENFGYRMLRFSSDSFTIATTEGDYAQLCEIVANMSTFLAEKQGLLPLTIKEERHT
ncbi:MAG: hypothetical protein K2N34_10930 [Lachnospiraceae bacterium]|nr:hypothetical protein [Lachnospiraceae bacterium]